MLLKSFVLSLLYMVVSSNLFAATIFVDNTLNTNCLSNNYSSENRDCNGTDGSAFRTIQSAINASSIGDTIQMRGGTYKEIAIDIPESKNGTSWTAGNYTTLMSYPGEWAIVDGAGLNTSSSFYYQAVFTHPKGYGVGTEKEYTAYWKFSNFEVTGGWSGFFLKADHLWWQYMYIHNNGRNAGDSLSAGILLVCPRYSTIEYSRFEDNIQPSSDLNNSNILFDSDYKDSSGNGEAFNPKAATHHNIVRYNYLTGSRISLRQKNQQRFGYNDRNPDTLTYKDYGDKWHHNIILDANESIGASQDFIQIYNNITDATINVGRWSGSSGDIPIVYNGVIYNNTVKRDATDATYGSYVTSGGHNTSWDNFYDVLPQKTVHEHVWFLNNIASNNPNAYQESPFILHWNIPANTDNPDQDNSDIVLNGNVINNNNNAYDYVIGHNYDEKYKGCSSQYIPSNSINECTELWRDTTGVENWDINGDLFLGGSTAEQYIINGAYSVGSGTLADKGVGGKHPYLTNVTIPSYIGATDPSNNDWVEGVLGLDVPFMRQASGEPIWASKKPARVDNLRIMSEE